VTEGPLIWRGEVYLSVREVASCYGVEVREIEHWIREQLLELPRTIDGKLAIPLAQLDRVARLVQYTRMLDLDTRAIQILIPDRFDRSETY
jgi:hypothetical protein